MHEENCFLINGNLTRNHCYVIAFIFVYSVSLMTCILVLTAVPENIMSRLLRAPSPVKELLKLPPGNCLFSNKLNKHFTYVVTGIISI